MAQPDDRISVSRMAEIHSISRQTLIFYDKINLFRPALVEENGYRYYSYKQIPYLREICFLKSVGIKLEDIKEHIEHRSPVSALALLRQHEGQLAAEIAALTQMRQNVTQRIAGYEKVMECDARLGEPFVTELPERQVVFIPWGTEDVTRRVLHLTLMKAWTLGERYDTLPPSGWGALVLRDALESDNPARGAGAYVYLSGAPKDASLPHVRTLPAGQYACMFKCGMPYDTDDACRLKGWIEQNGYAVAGDVADECCLDTTFYNEERSADLCQLQIPIQKKDRPGGNER